MTWRTKALRELRAGSPIILCGGDFADPAEADSLAGGLLTPGLPPDTGDQVWVESPAGGKWYHLVRDDSGYIGYADDSRRTAIRIEAETVRPFEVRRAAMYRIVADDLGCRGGVENLCEGIWTLGTIQIPNRGRAKVHVVERGISRDTFELTLRKSPFVTLCVLFPVEVPKRSAEVGAACGKTLVTGVLSVDSHGKFHSPVLADLDGIEAPEFRGALIDLAVTPPLFILGGERIELPMDGARATSGVLLLAHLFEHPREVISSWDLEGAVFPERREKHGVTFGVDDRLSPEAEGKLKHRARELKEILSDSHATPEEIDDARDELERIGQEIAAARSLGGRRKQLGSSDAQRATGRVRKALDKVVERVREQNAELGQLLDQALDRATEVQFRPPPHWGL